MLYYLDNYRHPASSQRHYSSQEMERMLPTARTALLPVTASSSSSSSSQLLLQPVSLSLSSSSPSSSSFSPALYPPYLSSYSSYSSLSSSTAAAAAATTASVSSSSLLSAKTKTTIATTTTTAAAAAKNTITKIGAITATPLLNQKASIPEHTIATGSLKNATTTTTTTTTPPPSAAVNTDIERILVKSPKQYPNHNPTNLPSFINNQHSISGSFLNEHFFIDSETSYKNFDLFSDDSITNIPEITEYSCDNSIEFYGSLESDHQHQLTVLPLEYSGYEDFRSQSFTPADRDNILFDEPKKRFTQIIIEIDDNPTVENIAEEYGFDEPIYETVNSVSGPESFDTISLSDFSNISKDHPERLPLPGPSMSKPIELFDVFFDLHERGLGMSIRGGVDSRDSNGSSDIYISKILAGGAVFEDGRLKLNDVLLEVNKNSLQDVKHETAVQHIRDAVPYVHFRVRRTVDEPGEETYEDIDDENNPLLCDGDGSSEAFVSGAGVDDSYGIVWPDSSDGRYIHNTSSSSSNSDKNLVNVTLTRNINGFGLHLTGGSDNRVSYNDPRIYVSRIVERSPAHLSGQIDIGDQLVAVNRHNLECLPYQRALDFIRDSPPTAVFTIRKNIHWG